MQTFSIFAAEKKKSSTAPLLDLYASMFTTFKDQFAVEPDQEIVPCWMNRVAHWARARLAFGPSSHFFVVETNIVELAGDFLDTCPVWCLLLMF